MKPKNFPGRKLSRQMKAKGVKPTEKQLTEARMIRTKKPGKGIPGGGRTEIK
ncbi:MAG: hypothetical protein JRI41_08135 [Deltaproteobacteria bacterium]|nr:hypothetical protein [Deltaproteobacteria bacterium]